MRWLTLPLLALVSGGAAASLEPSTIADALLGHAEAPQLARLETGVRFLRVLFLIDSVLLLALAVRMRRSHGRATAAGPSPASGAAASLWHVWGLVSLLGVAAAIRWVGLGGDLWMDEVFTLVNYVQPGLGTVLADFTDDNQHVLYSLSAWGCVALFGESPTTLRLPALLFGLASIWATVRLGRHAIGPREAWCAGLLLAVSYHHVWFSQNARGYTLLLCATLLATDLLLRARASGSARVWIAYALTLAFGMWGHLTMIFVAAGHGLILGWHRFRAGAWAGRRDEPVWALALAGWLTLHLYAVTLPQMLDYFGQPGAGSSTGSVAWTQPVWLFNETIRNLGVGLALGWIGAGGAIFVGAYGVFRVWRQGRLLTVAMLLPAVLGGVTMVLLGRNLWPRFFFNSFGFVALIAMSGAVGLGERVARTWFGDRFPDSVRRGLTVAPALVLVLASAATLPRVYRFPKQDYTSARDYVRARLGVDDQVVALHMAGRVYSRYYAPEWREVSGLDDVRSRLPGGGRTWVLYTLPSYLAAAQPNLVATLESDFELMKVFPGTLGDGEIVVRRGR